MPRYAALLFAALLAVSGAGVVSAASAPPPAANADEALWSLYKTAYSGTIYELVDDVTPTPISFERWRDTYGLESPLPTPTDYVKYPWSASTYAVTFWPASESQPEWDSPWQWDRLDFAQWRAAGSPNPRTAGWIEGSSIWKYGTSPELRLKGPGDGFWHTLTYPEWAATEFHAHLDFPNSGFMKLSWAPDIALMTDIATGQGSPLNYRVWRASDFPTPEVRTRITGDQFYQNAGSATIYYAGPTMNRAVTFAEWTAAGQPQPTMNGH